MKEYRLKSRPEVSVVVTDLLFYSADYLYYALTGDYNAGYSTEDGHLPLLKAARLLKYVNLDSSQMMRTGIQMRSTDVGKDLIWLGIARARRVRDKEYGVVGDGLVQRLDGLIDDILPEAREEYIRICHEGLKQQNLGVDILDD